LFIAFKWNKHQLQVQNGLPLKPFLSFVLGDVEDCGNFRNKIFIDISFKRDPVSTASFHVSPHDYLMDFSVRSSEGVWLKLMMIQVSGEEDKFKYFCFVSNEIINENFFLSFLFSSFEELRFYALGKLILLFYDK